MTSPASFFARISLVPPETIPPYTTPKICTSCAPATNKSVDRTPTINWTATDETGVAGLCIMNSSTGTYDDCIANGAACTPGSGTDHICTPSTANQLPLGGSGTFYVWGLDVFGNNHTVFNSSITIDVPFLQGNVTDSNGVLVTNAIVMVMVNSTGDTISYNISTATGLWTIPVLPDIYTVCAYKPENSTLRGDCVPFIEVT